METGLRIVVAEDESIIRMDLVEMLRESGATVVGEAGDGETALALIRGLLPDVALLDIQMPVVDGLEVARQVREEALCAVVMVTAFSQQSLVQRAANAGAMGYLVKPLDPVALMPAIAVARAGFERTQSLRTEVATLEDRLATRKLIERAKSALQQRLGIDESAAFRWLQKAAMDRRSSMRAIAEQVLSSTAD
ncbi:MAG: ANTAR domain-containing response regulator [Candidatus Nanopelagicales bacterium]